jgi:hypothetical protein
MSDPVVVTELVLTVLKLGSDAWDRIQRSEKDQELSDQVAAALRLSDANERRCQLSPLLSPLQSFLHKAGKDDERAKALHLTLAAAYGAIGEQRAQAFHLNRACDCAVRLRSSTWLVKTKAACCREVEELQKLLGDARETLVG